MCIQGFRSILLSRGMENGYAEYLIEKQLSHINADSTITAYDRAEYLDSLRDRTPDTQASEIEQQ